MAEERSRDIGWMQGERGSKAREGILRQLVNYLCNQFVRRASHTSTQHAIAMSAKQPFLFLFSASLIMSCSSGGDPVSDAVGVASGSIERVVSEVVVSSGVPVTKADLVIEGMTCEMMCGGSIKKALAKVDGVESTEIIFTEGEEADHAVVTYDEAEVSDAELVAAIQALYDGQYQVKGISITRQVKGSASTGAREVDAVEESKVSVYAPAAILLPSVITILGRILGE